MKAIIFDMDGTLLDSMSHWYESGRIATEPYLKDDPEFIAQMQKMSSQEIVRHISQNLTEEEKQEFKERWYQVMTDFYATKVKIKEGVIPYLKANKKKKIKMCVATATPRFMALKAIEHLGLSSYFEFLMDEEEAGVGKFRPDIYLKCAERLGYKPHECVVFEDNVRFSLVAKKAGFVVYGVYDDLSKRYQEEMKVFCDRYIYSFKELL
ncbi:HAD family phosphatase [bacterium]|jgi:HAD superfamily hydrolase (TIGR01509 family)|nr:HAD family phosphatase [bacterium]